MVSAIETLADENLQDELFKRGISDSQVYGLHRAEQALFFCRCSPLLSPHLVWNALLLLQRRAQDISPGAVLCQIELVSLSVAILCAVCFCCGIRQSAPAFCSPLEFSMTVRATVCLAFKATLGGFPDGFTMFLVR